MTKRDLIIVFDTETTGKTDFKSSFDAPGQPNLVQLGYKVYDRKKNVIFEIGHLVDSTLLDGWNGIEEGAYNVHGITEERIMKYGWRPDQAAEMFVYWYERSFMSVAHNNQFDIRIMQKFLKQCNYSPALISEVELICTMMRTTNICKIPHPKGWNSYKWPSLAEAYQFFFNKQFQGAHNALADVNPTADIFWRLVDSEIITLGGPNVTAS